jgi:processive 1,2-diacylglycerol beta-glucosyltransferase
MAVKLKKFFKKEFNPDVIVCTHIFSAQIVNVMKANGQLDAVTIGIITDYTIHPFWQDVSSIDYFVTASELLTRQAVKKGVSEEKLLPLGIPINPKFSKKIDKIQARKKLGIAEDTFTILLMSGSMGHGNLTKVLTSIDNLDNDFQVLAVCGNNRHAKHKIERLKTKKKVFCYGYVDNVELMMDAADCIVTKPGGLSSSEALAKHLPIVMINPIPGQEERNVEFMLNNGLAVNITKTFPVDEAFYQLFLYPEKLKNMAANIKLVGKPNATRDLCEFILKLKK